MVITIFRSRLDAKNEAEYRVAAERMREIAMGMPGLVSFKAFAADDGERLSMIVFDSVEAQKAWREHPEHREAQRRGWESFYSEFSLVVCENPRLISKGSPPWAQPARRLE
jgi:heme-degrading monooxygenase HmoA